MKRPLILAMVLVTLSTIFTACSHNFTCTFNGKIEFKNTGNTPSIAVDKLQNAAVTLYNEAGEIVASTSDFTDNQYAITVDMVEGNYKIIATAKYEDRGRTYSLYATTGMFFIPEGTSTYTNDLLCMRP